MEMNVSLFRPACLYLLNFVALISVCGLLLIMGDSSVFIAFISCVALLALLKVKLQARFIQILVGVTSMLLYPCKACKNWTTL